MARPSFSVALWKEELDWLLEKAGALCWVVLKKERGMSLKLVRDSVLLSSLSVSRMGKACTIRMLDIVTPPSQLWRALERLLLDLDLRLLSDPRVFSLETISSICSSRLLCPVSVLNRFRQGGGLSGVCCDVEGTEIRFMSAGLHHRSGKSR